MNKYIKQLVLLAAVALVSWGCESDFYNEHMIDGYEPETEITDVQSIEYTLTEDDYSTISKNSTNKTNAEAAGQEAVNALAAIGKNKYFSTPDEAAAYVPAFLSSAYPTLDNNSIVMVTYTTALDMPAEVAAMNAATEYTLTEDNYKTIWESEEDYVKAVTPATASKLKTVIPSEGLEAGQYVAVTYNYSAEEPKTEEEPENPDQPEQPDQPDQPTVEFPGEGQYLIVAQTGDVYYTMSYVPAEKTYGYPKSFQGLTPENSAIAADETSNAYAFMLEKASTEGQYFLREVTGTTRYYYTSGTYKNFSVSPTLDATSADYAFTITANEDGTVQVKSCSTNRVLQQGDGSYDSYGLYDTQLGSYPRLYKLNAEGTAYVDVTTLEATPTNNYTSVLGSAALNDAVEVKGYISALSTQGPILTDNSGSVLLYKTTGYELGDELTVTGTISSFNFGFQIGTSGISIEKTGTTTVTYPTAMEITGAKADELLTTRTADEYAYYAKMTGTVAVSGNYYNFNLDGATTAVGSIYGATDEVKSWLSDGQQCTIYGYFISISKTGGNPKYINMIVTSVESVSTTAATKAATVQSEKQYAYFKWNGTAFEDAAVLPVQPADYTEMGQKYGNFTNPAQDNYLPAFLGQKYPYAQEGDVKYVAYRCYVGGATSWKVDEYTNTGSAWVKTVYFASKTDQFRKAEGAWAVDRTLELDFTGNGADTKAFYQYCVNWVYDNKDVPMGAPARDNAGVIVSTDIVTINGEKPAGNYWVSNYGNNEFYTGASAYYGNIDWRASACKGGFAAAGMGDLSDDEIVEKLKEHTAEVFAEVLSYVYPEMTPAEYKKVVIKVYAYGPNVNYSFTFDVVDTGKFQYAEGSMTQI